MGTSVSPCPKEGSCDGAVGAAVGVLNALCQHRSVCPAVIEVGRCRLNLWNPS
jgi:hypothetical protein